MKAFHAGCTKCGAQMHVRASTCQNCGAPNPLRMPEDPKHLANPCIEETGPGLEPIDLQALIASTAAHKPTVVYVADRDFRCDVNGVLLAFTKGQFIDPAMLQRLIDFECPIVPKGEETVLCRCPKCGHLFEPDDDEDEP